MLERIFGNHTTVKILEALATSKNIDKWLTLREIARQAGDINPGTVKRAIDYLVKNKVIIEQNPSKRIRIFKLNLDDHVVSRFVEFKRSIEY